MSKEYLEAKPEDIVNLLYEVYDVPSGICEGIKNMIQHLEQKENSRAFGKDIINLNETLKQTIDKPMLYASRYGNKYIVPQELFENQCNALSVIKEKNVNIAVLKNSPDLKYYNYHVSDWRQLTQEEFDLLKRWLKNKD